MEINSQIEQSIQVISISLVIISIWFGWRYPIMKEFIDDEYVSNTARIKRQKKKKRLIVCIIANNIPLSILLIIMFVSMLPLAVEVIRNSIFTLWKCDILRTTYVLLINLILLLLNWSVYISIKLISKVKRI